MIRRIHSLVLLLILLAPAAASGCDALLRACESSEETMACCAAGGGCHASMAEAEPGEDAPGICLCEERSEPMPIRPANLPSVSTQGAPDAGAAPVEVVFASTIVSSAGVARAVYSPPRNHTYLLNSAFRI